MSQKTIILAYNEKRRKIKIPKNFEELKEIFLSQFHEGKNKKFYFSYLSFIDKDIDFIKLTSQTNENNHPIINVFQEKEKENEKEKKEDLKEEVIVGMSPEYFLKNKKKQRKKQKHLEEKQKEEIKLQKAKTHQNENNFNNINYKEKELNEGNNSIKETKEKKGLYGMIKKSGSENIHNINLEIIDLQPSKEIVNDAYNFDGVINAFCVFQSNDNLLYIVYTTRFNSIISFNISEEKKIKEIKEAHNDKITNFRYCLDDKNKLDLIISISSRNNNIKLWKSIDLILLYNFENINESGTLKSACFLNYKEEIFIVVSNSNNFDKAKAIKVYELNGNQKMEINNSKDDTYFIDVYYDSKLSKNYIITGNYYDVKSYDFDENKLYYKYFDKFSKDHCCAIINDDDDGGIIKLIESSKDGNVRIWDFHSGKLMNKIQVSNNRLFDLCLWDNNYLLVGCGEEIIKLIDLKVGKKIKTLHDFNSVISLKKINHPKYGKCLISQGNEIEQIMLWIKKISL